MLSKLIAHRPASFLDTTQNGIEQKIRHTASTRNISVCTLVMDELVNLKGLRYNQRYNVVMGGCRDKAMLDYDPAGNYSDAVQPDEIANKLALLAPYIGRNNGCLMLSDVV